ncbi:MAG: hypothetical protein ABI602_01430 [Candidatus Saccharibacteria bacterium]
MDETTPPIPAPSQPTAADDGALHVAPAEVGPPADTHPPAATEPELEPTAQPAPPVPHPPVRPVVKQPSHGSGLAITATVVIILGLAVLAVFAYLQTTK